MGEANGTYNMATTISHDDISEYYGRKLQRSGDLKTTACSAAKSPHPIIRKLLGKIPSDVSAQFYGCGSPVPLGIEGRRVLDLGCGSGQDCYLASALVGSHGAVTGIDMTAELLEVAEAHMKEYSASLGYSKSNMRFVEGRIEDLRAAGAVGRGSHWSAVPRRFHLARNKIRISCSKDFNLCTSRYH